MVVQNDKECKNLIEKLDKGLSLLEIHELVIKQLESFYENALNRKHGIKNRKIY